MNTIIYLLQVTACSAAFYLFYFLFLSRLTFFTTNRWYLLATVLLSFLIPVLRITLSEQQPYVAAVQHMIYVPKTAQPETQIVVQQTPVAAEPVHWDAIFKIAYFTMAIALCIHLLVTLLLFLKRIKGKRIAKIGKVNILSGQQKMANGSFLNYIFLNEDELSPDEIAQIIAHEMLHIKLYHSIDRILVKIAQILLWFNPFIYLYARSVEENHEFEVDREIARSTDKHNYANLLLHLSVAGQGMLYHNFSKVPLKKRISMLFNKPSNKMKRITYVLIVPVVLVSCLAFARLKKADASHKTLSLEKQNTIKEYSIPTSQYYTRLHLKKNDGTYHDKIIISMPSGGKLDHELSPSDKVGFMIDVKTKKIYNEEEFKKISPSVIDSFSDNYFTSESLGIDGKRIKGYDIFFIFNTKKSITTPENKKISLNETIKGTIEKDRTEETKKGKIINQQVKNDPPNYQYYKRRHFIKKDGTYYDQIEIYKFPYVDIMHTLSPTDKPGFIIDKKIYNEEEFKKILPSVINSFSSSVGTGTGPANDSALNHGLDASDYDVIFSFNTKKPGDPKDIALSSALKEVIEKMHAMETGKGKELPERQNDNDKINPQGKDTVNKSGHTNQNNTHTIEFATKRYNLPGRAVLSQLLNMLPNIKVDNDGSVSYNGVSVSHFTINNYEYKEGDIKHAVQHVAAFQIDSVQVSYSSTKNSVNTLNVHVKSDQPEKHSAGYPQRGNATEFVYTAYNDISFLPSKLPVPDHLGM